MKRSVLCTCATVLSASVFAKGSEFFLPPVFSDHAVLQQGALIPIWGTGPNHQWRLSCRVGETVTWTQTFSSMRNEKGWDMKFYLPPMKAGGPYEMVFSNGFNHATHVIHDVYVGEVWLASGQSNMAFTMGNTKNAIAEPRIEKLRIFTGSKWIVAGSNEVQNVSAVATYFGRELQRELGCAVGILSLSVGGTLCETWMSRAALKDCPTTRAWVDEYERLQSNPETWEPFPPLPKEPPLDAGPAPETAEWMKPAFAAEGWTPADLPGSFGDFFGHAFNGAAWFRRTVDIPESWAGKDLWVRLPAIDQHDILWFDGVEVGRSGKDRDYNIACCRRNYKIPGKLVKPGRRTLALRIWSFIHGAGFRSYPAPFSIGPEEKGVDPLLLEGVWLAKVERDLGQMSGLRLKRRPYGDGYTFTMPSSRYNNLIAPIIPYAMKGAVWYQGESNAGSIRQARDYATTLAALIADWRHSWGLGDFPFGIVQLANFRDANPHKRNSAWAELRDCQLRVSRNVKNTGLISAIDLGEAGNVHPRNKLDVGRRLCRWALSQVYGRDTGGPCTGPRYLSGALEAGGRVRIRFTEAEGGLAAKGPVTGCVMCGADGVWHPAEVAIDGETIVVSSAKVADPTGVRYAWSDNPVGATLVGARAQIPVFPFQWKKSPSLSPTRACGTIRGFEHVALDVADPVATARWWCENLGYTVTRQDGAPKFVTFIADPTGLNAIELYRAQDAPAAPDYTKLRPLALHVAFTSEDVDGDAAALVKAGATLVVREKAEGFDGAMLRDPSGIPIQLVSRAKSVLRIPRDSQEANDTAPAKER